MLAKRPITDFDLATDAFPEEVMKLFRRVIPTGIKHGTVTILLDKEPFEVTTFRIDGEYTNKRHPDSITYSGSLLDDLKRRDFTINSIAADAITGEIVDPNDGAKDLKKEIIKAIGNPVERFTEDGLRIMRGCRFASQLHFEIEKQTLEGMKFALDSLKGVSNERIRDELEKILKSDKPSVGFFLMEKTGVLKLILPELHSCIGVQQKGFHKFDVYTHSIIACDAAPQDKLELRLAALLHDIGKPAVLDYDELGIPTFYGHEKKSETMTEALLKRLRFPMAVVKKVCHLIKNHMFHYQSNWSDSAVRRFIHRSGEEHINDLLALRRADSFGTFGKLIINPEEKEFTARIQKAIDKQHSFTLKNLAVNGQDLASAGIPKGPKMGKVLQFLLDSVLEDPKQNEKKLLLKIAKNYLETYFPE